MPNHCDNRLTITGEPAALRKFVESASPDADDPRCREGQPLDYNKLCPMPANPLEQLDEGNACTLNEFRKHIRAGALTPLEEYNTLKDSGDPDDQRKAQHILDQAWYDWRIHHWSTKWNCYDGYLYDNDVDSGTIVYHFQSAWSPPIGVIRAAAEKFKNLKFVLEYAEPGCDFAGVFEAIGDVFDDRCENGVLNTEYGRELYQEMYDEMEQENAEDQDNCNT